MKTKFLQPLYNLYRNSIRNPKYRWWIILGTLLYLFSPFDLATDALPIVGWLDDGVLVTLLVSEVSQVMLESLKERRNQTSTQTLTPEVDYQSANSTTPENTIEVNAVSVR